MNPWLVGSHEERRKCGADNVEPTACAGGSKGVMASGPCIGIGPPLEPRLCCVGLRFGAFTILRTLHEFPTAQRFSGVLGMFSSLEVKVLVSIRRRPQGSYLSRSQRLSSVGSALYILMRSMRFSIPKSVKAITPSSPTP